MAALVFNALAGPELVNVILDKIRAKLEATGEFAGNVTFPWVKFDFNVGLTVYPKQAVDDAPGIVAKDNGVMGETDQPPVDETPVEVVVNTTAVIDVPDIARIESNQPLPTVAPGPGGVLIDKLVVPVVKDEGRKPFGYTGTDGKGKSNGPGNKPTDK